MTTLANFVLASAALLVSSGALAAQNVGKADVPFAFRIPGGSLPAGQYTVHTEASGTYIAAITSQDTHKSVLVPTPTYLTPPYNARSEKPRLVFRCSGDDCALSEIWLGTDGQSVPVRQPRHRAANERLAMISVTMGRAQ